MKGGYQIEYFEKLINKHRIFKDESVLNPNYRPRILPLRTMELNLISQLLLPLITTPNSLSRKILIIGKKSFHVEQTVLFLVESLRKSAHTRNISINNVYLDCKKWRKKILILKRIFQCLPLGTIHVKSTKNDLIKKLTSYLKTHDSHLILVLNNLQHLILHELFNLQRVSIIGITDDIAKVNNLPSKISSYLRRNIIKFANYTVEQIFDCLKERVDVGLQKGVISNELIERIAKLAFIEGNYEFGLRLLLNAGRIAVQESLPVINARIVDFAFTLLKTQRMEWRPIEIFPEDNVAY
ncbi:MAG: Cdc6/Cdc18 family protein [Candidatus Hodarchaeota archaeon]